MKKQYSNPDMVIIKIDTLPMLAGSKTIPTSSDPRDPNLSDAPSFDWDDEYDEE